MPKSQPCQLDLIAGATKKERYDFTKQLAAMVSAVGDGKFRSLTEIEAKLEFHYLQTSISAQLRLLRRGAPGFEEWTAVHDKFEGRHYYAVRRRYPCEQESTQ